MHVAIDGGDLLASYTTPGQYVQVRRRVGFVVWAAECGVFV